MAGKKTRREQIISNYYKNRDELMLQNLSEIVSELWLADDEFKKRKLWQRAQTAMRNLGVTEAEIKRLVERRDEKALAALLSRKF